MASAHNGRIYHPSKLFVEQLTGLLEFVTKSNLQFTDVDPVELKAMLDAQRAQQDQDQAEEQRHEATVRGLARAQALRHERFMQVLEVLRGHFRNDADTLAVLDGLKREHSRSEAEKAQSKAARERARVDRARERLAKLQARLSKVESLLKREEGEAGASAPVPPSEPGPTPGSASSGTK